MGDRIAIMREGGQLAQYATPAELLMAPADEFVEDFVGADRALKRLALMRVSDIDLWEAPLAYVGQATAEVRAKLDGRRGPLRRCSSTPSAGRSAGSPSATSQADTVPAQPDSPLGPVLDLDDVMRDALADLLQGETPSTRRWSTATAGSPASSRSRSSPSSSSRPRRRSRSTTRWSGRTGNEPDAALSCRPLLGAGRRSVNRTGPANAALPGAPEQGSSASAGRGQLRPLRRRRLLHQLMLVLIAVAIGFAIAFALALLSHRRRWLQSAASRRRPASSTRSPASPSSSCSCRSPGAGCDDGDHRPQRLHAADHLPQHRRGPRQRPAGRPRTPGRGMGMTDRQLLWRVELPLALPEIIAGLRIATVSTVAIATLMVFASVDTLGAPLYPADHVQDQHRDRRWARRS